MTKTFDKIAAQGDLLFIKIDELPKDAILQNPKDGKYVASHSETGHAHIIKPLIEHLRGFDTHESISFKKGIYEIRRQREHSPEGWRVAID